MSDKIMPLSWIIITSNKTKSYVEDVNPIKLYQDKPLEKYILPNILT
jgi:hypothetical protein